MYQCIICTSTHLASTLRTITHPGIYSHSRKDACGIWVASAGFNFRDLGLDQPWQSASGWEPIVNNVKVSREETRERRQLEVVVPMERNRDRKSYPCDLLRLPNPDWAPQLSQLSSMGAQQLKRFKNKRIMIYTSIEKIYSMISSYSKFKSNWLIPPSINCFRESPSYRKAE